jgi:hypothetical protein
VNWADTAELFVGNLVQKDRVTLSTDWIKQASD